MMHVHVVFVTKFRHRVFTNAHLRRMEEIMRSVCTDFECELVEFNGEDNHVHLLVNFPPPPEQAVMALHAMSDQCAISGSAGTETATLRVATIRFAPPPA